MFCKIGETNKVAEKTYQVPGSKSGKSKVHSLWAVVIANDGHFGNRTPKRINRAIQGMACEWHMTPRSSTQTAAGQSSISFAQMIATTLDWQSKKMQEDLGQQSQTRHE